MWASLIFFYFFGVFRETHIQQSMAVELHSMAGMAVASLYHDYWSDGSILAGFSDMVMWVEWWIAMAGAVGVAGGWVRGLRDTHVHCLQQQICHPIQCWWLCIIPQGMLPYR